MENKKNITPEFIIINNILFEPPNIILEEKIKDCVYIKNLGSPIHPKLYLKLRTDYEWYKEYEFIGNYDNLLKFFKNNKNNIICMDGFNRVTVARLIKILNVINDTNIKIVKFKNRLRKQQYLNHFLENQQQYHDELSSDLEMVCKLEDEYVETRLERPENTEPCEEEKSQTLVKKRIPPKK